MMTQMLKKADKDFKNSSSVKWNFIKFLINREGEIVSRLEPMIDLKKVRAKVADILYSVYLQFCILGGN